jgi:hypothetical protein
MTPKQIELARHALGLPNERRCSCSNRFIAGKGHADHAEWIAMVEAGYAQRHRFEKRISRRDCVFQLTDEGAKAAVMPGEELNPYDFPLAYVQMLGLATDDVNPRIAIGQLERHIAGLRRGTPLSAGPREFETELAGLAIVGLKAAETAPKDESRIIPRSQRKAALLEIALANLVYEATHLSPCNEDRSHNCRISAEALQIAREALQAA